jgi:hypothetical protein
LSQGKYLAHYAEAEATELLQHPLASHYDFCLIIPAYREDADLLLRLEELAAAQPGLLVILVLNQPDSDKAADANSELRKALTASREIQRHSTGSLRQLAADSHVLIIERKAPLPAKQGVGLARKIGCDIALALQASGHLKSRWLHNTDADATLTGNYFQAAEQQLGAVAITHPFLHSLPKDRRLALATYLYELRLHYYVLGLQQARSPYAFHTLGSCISVDGPSYAAVRGFPRRNAAEDFYLLNKVAKLGEVARPSAPAIALRGRASDRVPFGTGPAVAELARSRTPLLSKLYYHPDCFFALGVLLRNLPELFNRSKLEALPGLPIAAAVALQQLGIDKALHHCHAHSADPASWEKHFHQWFDGFRTLKFIHALRDSGLADLDLAQSRDHPHSIWPGHWQFQEELLHPAPVLP